MSSPMPLTFNGKTFKVHAFSDAMRDQFTNWIKSYVVRETLALKGIVPGFQSHFTQILHELGPGKLYEPGTTRFQQIMETPAGTIEYLRVILQEPELTDDAIAELLEAKDPELNALIKLVNGPEVATEEPAPKA